ncbi:MAG TPA: hypothetical protein VH740_12960 [Vicinamibacterales bacterium]|jgi:hypothetical protein
MPTGPPGVSLDGDRLRFATGLVVSLVRTTRVPDDGREYPLTAHHGEFPLRSALAYPDAAPANWVEGRDFFAPAHEAEAFFVAFEGGRPHAVQVDADGTNAISSAPAGAPLNDNPQNYVVCPPQPWLDGFHDGQRRVRQFRANVDRAGGSGLTLIVFPAHRTALAKFYTSAKGVIYDQRETFDGSDRKGGLVREAIVPDPLGIDSWDRDRALVVRIHFVDVKWFSEVTGEPLSPPPPAPPAYS